MIDISIVNGVYELYTGRPGERYLIAMTMFRTGKTPLLQMEKFALRFKTEELVRTLADISN
jgi:hypothetical protein